MEAVQSHVISQPVKSLSSVVLQEFAEFIINNGGNFNGLVSIVRARKV